MSTNIGIDKKTEDTLASETVSIILVNLKLLKMEPNKPNLDLAMTMFQEGIKFWEEKRRKYVKS